MLGECSSVIISGVTYNDVYVLASNFTSNYEVVNSKFSRQVAKAHFRFALPCNASTPKYNDKIVYKGENWTIMGKVSGFEHNDKWEAFRNTTLNLGDAKDVG